MTMQVQVVSPERILWSGDAELVTARTVEGGDITFLTGHAPFVGALETGKVTVRPDGGDDVFFAVHGGFVEVSADNVSLLTDVAEVFTGLPGVTTPVEETVESFEMLCRGDLDDLPEQAFLNVGGAEAARAKAEDLQKSAGE